MQTKKKIVELPIQNTEERFGTTGNWSTYEVAKKPQNQTHH